ncbi:probable E3 ubiquitin-protein ligase BAH1-like 2 isoform X1 [Brachypodium distachyon]|uniref:probable E3 ubiquitin-protein ligase BAH1-like 2 isoform X1 n=1 Tax=Brachypodium distachyon TaxID=15368 RepID=UPI0001C75634|nr:probable E3 ubiquitin-protein ligase BAH1-like 2 isoform X1 [Brachypodium distachyon]|eukprot:XP_010234106.1 probable E3 ubiquitin-protein ligase BAH1-like 2 isoform X1 [Brachypodium distachyon]
MKFAKKYETYMKGMEEELPGVGLKRLKKMLKKCRAELGSHQQSSSSSSDAGGVRCLGHCSVCDGSFFPSLLNEMSAVIGCFNKKAKKLLELHLASGFKKYAMWFTNKGHKSHGQLIQQGKDLVTYAIINAVAMRKILKKYDKIHYSKQGQEFKAQAQSLHIEILQSPWLCELMAFYMNLRRSKNNEVAMELFGDCSLTFDDDQPTLSCNLFDSMRVDISLMCSICLDTMFDPVSLSCGHIFCYLCCCSAASVTIVDGLKSADQKSKCPLCRQVGVFPNAAHLDELNMLISYSLSVLYINSCPEFWEKRMQMERVERVRLAKEHWESQCRAFLGI